MLGLTGVNQTLAWPPDLLDAREAGPTMVMETPDDLIFSTSKLQRKRSGRKEKRLRRPQGSGL